MKLALKTKFIIIVSIFLTILSCSSSETKTDSINGFWVSTCEEQELNQYFITSWDIQNEQTIKIERSEFSDPECRTLLNVLEARFLIVPNSVVKFGTNYAVDLLFNDLILTPKTLDGENLLNAATFCEQTDWTVGQTKDLNNLPCVGTLGFDAPTFETLFYNTFRIINNQLTVAASPAPFGALTFEERSVDFEGAPAYDLLPRPTQLDVDGVWESECFGQASESFKYRWDFRTSSPKLFIFYTANLTDCSVIDLTNEFTFTNFSQTGFVSGFPKARKFQLTFVDGTLLPLTTVGQDFLNNYDVNGACDYQSFTVDVPFSIAGQDCSDLYGYSLNTNTTFYNLLNIDNSILTLGNTNQVVFGNEDEADRPVSLTPAGEFDYQLVPNP